MANWDLFPIFIVVKGTFTDDGLKMLLAEELGKAWTGEIWGVDRSRAFELKCNVMVKDTLPVFHWFNRAVGAAPFPYGTLLWFRDLSRR